LGHIRIYPHFPILAHTEQEVMSNIPRSTHHLIGICPTVSDIHPPRFLWGTSRGLDPFDPQVRLTLAFTSLGGRPGFRAWDAIGDLLAGQSQNATRIRDNGEGVVLQEPATMFIADGSSSLEGCMRREIQFCGIM
jgi:hypothetical protein